MYLKMTIIIISAGVKFPTMYGAQQAQQQPRNSRSASVTRLHSLVVQAQVLVVAASGGVATSNNTEKTDLLNYFITKKKVVKLWWTVDPHS